MHVRITAFWQVQCIATMSAWDQAAALTARIYMQGGGTSKARVCAEEPRAGHPLTAPQRPHLPPGQQQ